MLLLSVCLFVQGSLSRRNLFLILLIITSTSSLARFASVHYTRFGCSSCVGIFYCQKPVFKPPASGLPPDNYSRCQKNGVPGPLPEALLVVLKTTSLSFIKGTWEVLLRMIGLV